ncbi:hypothetical protein BS50DRAFT_106091 [Corynespora cassiicola Philippines]|uniref:Uncharacterized protein n=1 Tax=Corynespora cassiicola Philippines TaxID=1448308 RepID=A0A2T2NDR4_CORCC|nr:hypothetical protein BS50DRAFT_106091 [Corynespora cassiicola Philippines]
MVWSTNSLLEKGRLETKARGTGVARLAAEVRKGVGCLYIVGARKALRSFEKQSLAEVSQKERPTLLLPFEEKRADRSRQERAGLHLHLLAERPSGGLPSPSTGTQPRLLAHLRHTPGPREHQGWIEAEPVANARFLLQRRWRGCSKLHARPRRHVWKHSRAWLWPGT